MPRLASRIDFEPNPNDPAEYEKAMYFNPHTGGGYNHPGRQKIYVKRADAIDREFGPPGTQKVVIAGCGYGYLVAILKDRGWDVVGFDLGDYALQRILDGEIPADKQLLVVKADVMDTNGPESTQTVRQLAGLTGQQKFDLCISEDLLPCLDDTELATALPNMRDMADTVAHIVTTVMVEDPPGTYMSAADLHPGQALNWKTPEDWLALVGSDILIRTGTYDVVT